MITEAIILAGGLGTRLKDAVPALPKCMAPVNRKPFVWYVVEHLKNQGITHFIFALGYKSEAFDSFFSSLDVSYQLSVETEPLGTGGAIKLALAQSSKQDVIVTNGDTLFQVNIATLSDIHKQKGADCTLSLKPMENFSRYGVVELNDSNKIISFKEKSFYEKGMINGGLYAVKRNSLFEVNLPDKFSFEKDYLEQYYLQHQLFGIVQEEYFIDIGIPEDYRRAQAELG